jgi:hypothetical protein
METTRSAACPKQLSTKRNRREGKENDILEAALDEADGWSGFRIGRSGIRGSPYLVDGEPGGSFE